jgi:hypothetical protein
MGRPRGWGSRGVRQFRAEGVNGALVAGHCVRGAGSRKNRTSYRQQNPNDQASSDKINGQLMMAEGAKVPSGQRYFSCECVWVCTARCLYSRGAQVFCPKTSELRAPPANSSDEASATVTVAAPRWPRCEQTGNGWGQRTRRCRRSSPEVAQTCTGRSWAAACWRRVSRARRSSPPR